MLKRRDNVNLFLFQECKQPITLFNAVKPWNMARIGLQWLTSHTGLGASSHLEAGGFIRSQEGLKHPDIQFHFLPSAVHDHGRVDPDRHAYQVGSKIAMLKISGPDEITRTL